MARYGLPALMVVVVVSALVLPPAASADHLRKRCLPAGSKTVTQTKTVRVFQWRDDVWGCLFLRGVRRRLDQFARDPYGVVAGPGWVFRMRSPWVAFEATISPYHDDFGSWTVIAVRDVADGELRWFPAAPSRSESEFAGHEEARILSLVVGSGGAAAWIACVRVNMGLGCDSPREYRVFKAPFGTETAAEPVLLEDSPAIQPRSLRLARNTLSWISGGQRRSAPLNQP